MLPDLAVGLDQVSLRVVADFLHELHLSLQLGGLSVLQLIRQVVDQISERNWGRECVLSRPLLARQALTNFWQKSKLNLLSCVRPFEGYIMCLALFQSLYLFRPRVRLSPSTSLFFRISVYLPIHSPSPPVGLLLSETGSVKPLRLSVGGQKVRLQSSDLVRQGVLLRLSGGQLLLLLVLSHDQTLISFLYG